MRRGPGLLLFWRFLVRQREGIVRSTSNNPAVRIGYYSTLGAIDLAATNRRSPDALSARCSSLMEFLILILLFALLLIYVVFREWMNVAYRQWLAELDLFKRRLAAYEQLKIAVASVHARSAVSQIDTYRFARAMSDMRFLFDKDLESFVGDIYGALLKKHALDSLLEKAAAQEQSSTDKALTQKALIKSQELSTQITNGIYRDMPKRMEKFMHPRPVLSREA